MTLPWKQLAQRLRIELFEARSCEGIARGGLEDALARLEEVQHCCDKAVENRAAIERLEAELGRSGVSQAPVMPPEDVCTPTERLLIEAVLDDWQKKPEDWCDWRLPHEGLIAKVLEERGVRALSHPLYGELSYRFQSLPWRRQVIICERLGLIRDEDGSESGAALFERTFPRVLERGALRHFQIQIDHERDAAGLERRTASPPDVARG